MSCGICVRINQKDEIDLIIKNDILEYKNVYLRDNEGYILVEK